MKFDFGCLGNGVVILGESRDSTKIRKERSRFCVDLPSGPKVGPTHHRTMDAHVVMFCATVIVNRYTY